MSECVPKSLALDPPTLALGFPCLSLCDDFLFLCMFPSFPSTFRFGTEKNPCFFGVSLTLCSRKAGVGGFVACRGLRVGRLCYFRALTRSPHFPGVMPEQLLRSLLAGLPSCPMQSEINQELKIIPKRKFWGRTSCGHPGDIRADIPAQNFGQGGQNPGKK